MIGTGFQSYVKLVLGRHHHHSHHSQALSLWGLVYEVFNWSLQTSLVPLVEGIRTLTVQCPPTQFTLREIQCNRIMGVTNNARFENPST